MLSEFAQHFRQTLAVAGRSRSQDGSASGPDLDPAVAHLRVAPSLTLLLDYDGTLVPIAPVPELATPDREVLELLTALARRPATQVHLVTGRSRQTCESWFAELPIGLWAEHGCWHRLADRPWELSTAASLSTPQGVLSILERYVVNTPGSLIETKSASIAWHYRMADRECGSRQACDLHRELEATLRNGPYEVLEGHKVLEVRPRGVSKASVVHHVLDHADLATTILAIGDDRTDDDMFRALPSSAVTIGVGGTPRHARYRVADVWAVRTLLRSLVGRSHG